MRPQRRYEHLTLTYHPPGQEAIPIGVLLWDIGERRLHHSFRTDWYELLQEEDREFAKDLSDDLVAQIRNSNGEEFLLYCEDTLSNILRISARVPLASEEEPEIVIRSLEQAIMGQRALSS
jgi:hypothetical protein